MKKKHKLLADIWPVQPQYLHGLENEAHSTPDQTLSFFDVPVRLSGLVEMLVSQRDNTHIQLMRCATWYKRKAMAELYPTRKGGTSLNQEMRQAVSDRAIQMVLEDCRANIARP